MRKVTLPSLNEEVLKKDLTFIYTMLPHLYKQIPYSEVEARAICNMKAFRKLLPESILNDQYIRVLMAGSYPVYNNTAPSKEEHALHLQLVANHVQLMNILINEYVPIFNNSSQVLDIVEKL